MNDKVKIYLSGGMGNLSFKESNEWRKYIKEKILGSWECDNASFFNPNDYFNFLYKAHDTEREVMEFDLHGLRNSDIVIVNFNDEKSIGTAYELAIAYDMRKPIIGLNADNNKLHPWHECVCNRIFYDIDNLIDYVVEFYLN